MSPAPASSPRERLLVLCISTVHLVARNASPSVVNVAEKPTGVAKGTPRILAGADLVSDNFP